jgi:putative ABC transport system permease protein
VRAALGAGTGRLIRQMLTESLVLALCGGVLGLGVAKLGVRALLGIMPSHQVRGMPVLTSAGLDAKVIGYCFLVSLAAGLVFGLLPAIRVTGSTSSGMLRSAGRGMIGGANRLRDSLVVGEIALTVILLSGAVLFGRSMISLLSIDPGFRAEHVATGLVVLPASSYPDDASQASAFNRLTDRLRGTPGVTSVGLITKLPLDFGNSLSFDVVGQPMPEAGKKPTASYRQVDAEYFRAMAIPIVSGRAFDARDDAKSPGTVVINRALANAYLGDVNPIGQRFFVFGDTMTVVGLVGDVPIGGIEDKIPPTVYVSFARVPQLAASVVIRSFAPLDETTRELRAAVASIDRSAAVTRIVSMPDLIAESPSVFMRRFPLYLLGAFALTALVLAVVGIYGVVSYSVAQRTREMGIRMALGAQASSLIGLVVRQGTLIVAAGIVIGVVAALLLGRFAETLLYGVRSSDPITYASVSAVLAAVAIGATLVPARRATGVDPALALRSE